VSWSITSSGTSAQSSPSIDIQQHSHPIGPENLPYTRRGRKAANLAEKDRTRIKRTGSPDPNLMDIASTSTAPQPDPAAPVTNFTSAVSMLAPLPGQSFPPAPQAQPFSYPPTVEYGIQVPNQERWDSMGTLFQAVREHARSYHYPAASVAALETVLIRLYLESPIGSIPQNMVNPGIAVNRPPVPTPVQMQPTVNAQPTMNGNTSNASNEVAS
jgi:hypothetical protein